MPNMARMIGHTRQILNQECDPWESPKIGPITARNRTLQQGVDNLAVLACAEAWLAACRSFTDQRGTAAFKPSALPPCGGLTTDPNTPRYFRRRITFIEHDRATLAPLLHFFVISLLSRHEQYYHVRYRCHSIIRDSIIHRKTGTSYD